MGRNTSASLGNYFEDFVESKIPEGRYKNDSEVIRAELLLSEDEENRIKALKNAIEEGINGGIEKNFNHKKYLQILRPVNEKMAIYFLTNNAVEDLSKN